MWRCDRAVHSAGLFLSPGDLGWSGEQVGPGLWGKLREGGKGQGGEASEGIDLGK